MRYIVIDKQGNTITKDYYKLINPYSDGYAWAIKNDDTKVFLDKNGNEVYNTKDYCYCFDEGLAPIEANKKIGFLNTNFDVAIKPTFQFAHPFFNGFSGVQKNNLWGVIDKLGNEIVPPKYQAIFNYSEGFAAFKKRQGWGLINEKGNETFYCSKAEFIVAIQEGLSLIKLNGKFGYCCGKGIVINPVYDNAKEFSNGFAAVSQNKLWHFINKDGTKAFDKTYKHVFGNGFSEGICAVSNNDYSLFFIDTKGNKITKDEYVSPKRFNARISSKFIKGLAIVAKDYGIGTLALKEDKLHKYLQLENKLYKKGLNKNPIGMINSRGENVIGFKYDFMLPFSEGVAVVKSNNRYYYISEKGESIFHQSFTNATSFNDDRAIVEN